MENEKTTQELLTELVSLQRRAARRSLITAVLGLVIVVALAAAIFSVVPRALALADRAETALGEIDTLMSGVGATMEDAQTLITNTNTMVETNSQAVTDAVQKMNDIDIDGLNDGIATLNRVVSENSDNVTSAIKKLNNIDFDKLNKAIADLSDAVHPLGEFARLFQK